METMLQEMAATTAKKKKDGFVTLKPQHARSCAEMAKFTNNISGIALETSTCSFKKTATLEQILS